MYSIDPAGVLEQLLALGRAPLGQDAGLFGLLGNRGARRDTGGDGTVLLDVHLAPALEATCRTGEAPAHVLEGLPGDRAGDRATIDLGPALGGGDQILVLVEPRQHALGRGVPGGRIRQLDREALVGAHAEEVDRDA